MRLLKTTGIVSLIASLIALVFCVVGDAMFVWQCPFFAVTGLKCPGCGGQRAFIAMIHGDVSSALRHNVLAVAGLPLFAVAVCVFRSRWQRAVIAVAALLVAASFFVVRNFIETGL